MLLIVNILAVFSQFKKVISCFTVSIFKAIVKFIAFRCFYDMCKETEIIAEGK